MEFTARLPTCQIFFGQDGNQFGVALHIISTVYKHQNMQVTYICTNFRGMEFSGTIKIQDFRGFVFEDHLLSTLELHMHCDCSKKFQGFDSCG